MNFSKLKLNYKDLLPLYLLLVIGLIAILLVVFRPSPNKRMMPPEPVITVDTLLVKSKSTVLYINSLAV